MKHLFYSLIIFCSFILTANAQVSTTTTDSSKVSTTTGKIFSGARQYSTWSLGANIGVTSPFLAVGGSNASSEWKAGLGYGISLRDKLAHSFSLQFDFHGGTVAGDNANAPGGTKYGYQSFSTGFYSGTFTGLVNVASMDFLHRANSANFYLSTGAGLIYYTPTYIASDVSLPSYKAATLVIPVGGSVKFKLSDALALNVGYTMNFLDDDNFAGYHTGSVKSHYSYGYIGLEYTFGTGGKRNLDWVNPISVMYDELYDAELRTEVAALKTRTGNVETAISDLRKDSDGDGVSDQFDKCPNTPAGTVVDGSGCPLVLPKPDTVRISGTGAMAPASAAYANIQFEFDSSVLKTASYPILDATAADLKTNGNVITIAGYASSEGTAAHNMRLSKDRANSVKIYLVNSGVSSSHLKIRAYGETHPVADNSTEQGRIRNRRVEFHK